jgi:hypothetical protein
MRNQEVQNQVQTPGVLNLTPGVENLQGKNRKSEKRFPIFI